jgi:uncharacterized integral membrane protein
MTDPGPTSSQGPSAGGSPQQPGAPQQHGGAPQQRSKREISMGQILGLIFFALIIVFIFENSHDVQIRIIGPVVTAPLYVAILISAVLGALGAWLLRYRRARSAQRKRDARQYRSGQGQR